MNKKVTVVYDDTRKPNREIASITGNKSFGDTIFKRKTLRERTTAVFEAMSEVKEVVDASSKEVLSISGDNPVLLFFSGFGIADAEEMQKIAYKACFAHENYRVTDNGVTAAVIFKDADCFKEAKVTDFSGYAEIKCEGLSNLSEVHNFRSFITSGFEARYFNSLKGDEYTLIKSSDNTAKIYAEYCFYNLLPDDMKQWFVRPYGYEEGDNTASYKMQRYYMTDLAIRYVHGSISEKEFDDILTKLFYFVKIREKVPVSAEEYDSYAEKLYIKKVDDRIAALKACDGYDRIETLIKSCTSYGSIDRIAESYKELYDTIRKKQKFEHVKVIGHGDMCFSNILYSQEVSQLLLIDPKGATQKEDMYMDPFYDLAKLSHSVCGHYDFFNSDLYEITFDENLGAKLTLDADNRKYVQIYKERLEKEGYDFRLIRLYEASLFLSMLPLHMDRPKKVFAFILNAVAILESLRK